jgi:hypothetical protein
MAINHQLLMEQSVLQLQRLVKARRELDAAILRTERSLRHAATAVARENNRTISFSLLSKDTDDMGVTEAIRKVLHAYPIWLSPVSIRDLLHTVGFDSSRYKHPLTSIHSILRRLITLGEVVRIDCAQRGHMYTLAENCGDERPTGSQPHLHGHDEESRRLAVGCQSTNRLIVFGPAIRTRSREGR